MEEEQQLMNVLFLTFESLLILELPRWYEFFGIAEATRWLI